MDWQALRRRHVGQPAPRRGRGRAARARFRCSWRACWTTRSGSAGRRARLGQKSDQALAARELEQHWSKAQILEAYLNLVTFRGELVGIGAAARGLFGKHAGRAGRARGGDPRGAAARRRTPRRRSWRSAPAPWLPRPAAGAPLCADAATGGRQALPGRYRHRRGRTLAPHVARADC
ncbi:MAG: transglycosylase domain-containing protein [Chromatiales bacterium]|nr:transglycosylase domain-containing protein [Chromatiales bacterium]